jgi:cytochrome bd-type quinol oxidase subunit 2
MAVLIVPLLALVGLWIVALADVIRADDMEQTGRLILAAVLLFAAPIGVLIWLVVRAGRAGRVLAAAMVAVSVVVVGVVAATQPSIHVQSVDANGSAPGNVEVPVPIAPSR